MQYIEFAEVYDALMADVPYKAWTDFVLKIAGTGIENMTMLELAAGTGNASVLLAPKLKQLISSDISDDMLRIAAEKFRKAGQDIKILNMDMTDFEIHKQADIVACICDGVNCLTTLSEVDAAFTCVRKALKTGGCFVFDISSANKLENMADKYFGEDLDDLTYIWQNYFDEKEKTLEMNLTFFVKQGEVYRRFDETHIQRAHSAEEIISKLKKNGFNDIDVYDNYTFRAPLEKSERLTFVAR